MREARRIVIEVRPGEVRAAAIDVDGTPFAFEVERRGDRSQVGAIYVGRVTAVRANLGAAFVNIGAPLDGFLNLKGKYGPGIEEGRAVVVRVTRDAEGDKGARLAAGIELPDGIDIATLPVPSEIMPAPGLPTRCLNAWFGAGTEQILIDDADVFNELRRVSARDLPAALDRLERTTGAVSVFDMAGLADAFAAALQPVMPLPGGGTLLIHETPAMTTIDVNAGRAEAGGAERLALDTNVQAAVAVARALRLRAIGGLIAVDFLRMNDDAGRARVLAALKDAFAGDPGEPQAAGFSPFGVVEIVRRRRGPSLAGMYLQAVTRKTAETVALEALDAVRRRGGAAATLKVTLAVAAQLQGPLAPDRRALESRLGFDIRIEAVSHNDDERFEIEDHG